MDALGNSCSSCEVLLPAFAASAKHQQLCSFFVYSLPAVPATQRLTAQLAATKEIIAAAQARTAELQLQLQAAACDDGSLPNMVKAGGAETTKMSHIWGIRVPVETTRCVPRPPELMAIMRREQCFR